MKWIIFDEALICPHENDTFGIDWAEEEESLCVEWHKGEAERIDRDDGRRFYELCRTKDEAVARLEELSHLLNRPYG